MKREEADTSSRKDVSLTANAGYNYFGNDGINSLSITDDLEGSPRSPGAACGALAPPDPGELGASPILDTSTPESGQTVSSVGRLFNRRNRRFYSRAIWGLKLPGRYYFLTLTTAPGSPALLKIWNALRKWLKRYRPGICWLYCFTTEGKGQGVIHMILRLGHQMKNLDVVEVRAYWHKLTGAKQVKILRTTEADKEDLAGYLANQKRKRGLAKEMGYQSTITRWRWSKGWLPRGFTKEFGRAWVRLANVPYGLKLKIISEWLLRFKLTDGDTWVPYRMEKLGDWHEGYAGWVGI